MKKKRGLEQQIHHQTRFLPTSRLKQHGEVCVTAAIWSSNWEKVLGSISASRVTLQNCPLRVPTYNPKMQTMMLSVWEQIATLISC